MPVGLHVMMVQASLQPPGGAGAVAAWMLEALEHRHELTVVTGRARVKVASTTPFDSVPWNQRENAFLCIGRLTPEKNVDRVIDILAEVRKRVRDGRLVLVGTAAPGQRPSYRRVMRRVALEATGSAFART